MRKMWIIFPGDSTIWRWLQFIKYIPGFTNDYLDQIKIKLSAMNYNGRKCVILHDEMSILKCIEYKALDMIECFEDLGSLGWSSKYTKHALVVMVRGLYTN